MTFVFYALLITILAGCISFLRRAWCLWKTKVFASKEIEKRRQASPYKDNRIWGHFTTKELDELRGAPQRINGYPHCDEVRTVYEAEIYRDTAKSRADNLKLYVPVLYTVLTFLFAASVNWFWEELTRDTQDTPALMWKTIVLSFVVVFLFGTRVLQMRANILTSYSEMYSSLIQRSSLPRRKLNSFKAGTRRMRGKREDGRFF